MKKFNRITIAGVLWALMLMQNLLVKQVTGAITNKKRADSCESAL